MAPKGHRDRPTGLIRTHSRGASASKLGLNLYFTQKDPTQPRQPEKNKKNGHLHEVRPSFIDSSSVRNTKIVTSLIRGLHLHFLEHTTVSLRSQESHSPRNEHLRRTIKPPRKPRRISELLALETTTTTTTMDGYPLVGPILQIYKPQSQK